MARVGRLREFDRDHALEKAMELFWRQGYEGTTPADRQGSCGRRVRPYVGREFAPGGC